jgi:hypothetical protein
MFPETFVEKWMNRITSKGDTVLDPFCGRGTTPFQALLMDRAAIASDINPVAYCITKAKTNAPSAKVVRRRLTNLEKEFSHRTWEPRRRAMPEFFHAAYSSGTLRQLLFLRDRLQWVDNDADCMIAALTLGALHGESEKSRSYLSNQMPRTISTKPAYSIRFWKMKGFTPPDRNAFDLLRERVTFRYESDPPTGRGTVIKADMRELPRLLTGKVGSIKCAITSPPYLDVTNFEEDQWLRLWFLRSKPHPTYRLISKDDRHERPDKYWNLIADMWRVLGQVLDKNADVIIRIGGKDFNPQETGNRLMAACVFSRRKGELIASETTEIRKKQTDAFRPGSKGCLVESDFHFRLK